MYLACNFETVEEAVRQLEEETKTSHASSLPPIVIRLSGHVHTNDRIALKEIGRQLLLQNGPSALDVVQTDTDEDEDEDKGFLDGDDTQSNMLGSQLVVKVLYCCLPTLTQLN